jgi:hypothetical protein
MFQRIRTGPINWNISNRGVGWSIGLSGFRYGINASGKKYISVGIPRTGIYWLKYLDEGRQQKINYNPNISQSTSPQILKETINKKVMSDQIPFIDVEFLDNPEPRCPVVLLLDVSGSMSGAPIEALNEGVSLLSQELLSDKLASMRVEISIFTFGDGVKEVQDFVSPSAFFPPSLIASGSTPMGEAVVKACETLEVRKNKYKQAGIGYYRPWIFLITDGAPTDSDTHYWRTAVDLVRSGEQTKKLLFFGVSVEGADKTKLNELCPPNRPSMALKGLSFRELFSWLSSSLKSVSSEKPGAAQLALPSPQGWTTIDI